MLLAALLLFSLVLSGPSAYAEGLPFTDVKEGRWYYDAVSWAYENEYVSGVTPTTFEPNKVCSRAEFVMILWGIAGKPEPTIENPFTDVREGKWYYSAVLWAKETGLTDGKTPTTFAPNDTCTRAEAVFFIWKYFGSEIVSPEVSFKDVRTNAYYYNAVNWAFSNGVTSGMDLDLFSPKTNVTRAMVVTFLYRQKHVLDGGRHEFSLIEVLPETCTQGASKTYSCLCGNKKTIFTSEPLGHDFCKAELIADATANTPTIYQLVCIRCGEHDGNGNRSLGKPIFGPPVFHSNYRSHQWTQQELVNGIQFSSSDGATATIRRKWFANAWCYIAEMVLPEGAYSHLTGTNLVNMFGSNNSNNRISAYNLMKNTNKVSDAQILFNGDTRLFVDRETMRGGKIYTGKSNITTAGWDMTYWNPSTGTYGTIRSLGFGSAPSFTTLKGMGVTDVYYFRVPTIQNGRMDMTEFYSEADYDPHSYEIMQDDHVEGTRARRQCTMMGFKKEGDTVHVYFVVADGNCVTNHDATKPNEWSNDFASYGNSKREMMILLSTLGADYAMNMDGGHSAAMIIRRNGVVEQISATDRDSIKINGVTYSAVEARKLWDFIYFK